LTDFWKSREKCLSLLESKRGSGLKESILSVREHSPYIISVYPLIAVLPVGCFLSGWQAGPNPARGRERKPRNSFSGFQE